MNKGKVYLLTDWDSSPQRYKIGITKGAVENRIKSLQTGSSGEIVLLQIYESERYKMIETILKRGYKHYSTNGGKEWFYLPDENVINFKKECKRIEENIINLNLEKV
jgi:hypothetical protein